MLKKVYLLFIISVCSIFFSSCGTEKAIVEIPTGVDTVAYSLYTEARKIDGDAEYEEKNGVGYVTISVEACEYIKEMYKHTGEAMFEIYYDTNLVDRHSINDDFTEITIDFIEGEKELAYDTIDVAIMPIYLISTYYQAYDGVSAGEYSTIFKIYINGEYIYEQEYNSQSFTSGEVEDEYYEKNYL